MIKTILALALVLAASVCFAQVPTCICDKGCTVISDPFPPGPDQPTYCAAYKLDGTTLIAGGKGVSPTVPAGSVPATNAGRCTVTTTMPAFVAGSVVCSVALPPQPIGVVTITVRSGNDIGAESDAVPLQFTNAAALPVPKAPKPGRPRPNGP